MRFSNRRCTFYEHSGVDYKGTARAALVSLKGDYGSQGGSTITQQVIKITSYQWKNVKEKGARNIFSI